MGEQDLRAGVDAERREMVLADPCRMHPELLGVERFVDDVGDEGVGRALVVAIIVIAQREVAEFHSRTGPFDDALPYTKAYQSAHSCARSPRHRLGAASGVGRHAANLSGGARRGRSTWRSSTPRRWRSPGCPRATTPDPTRRPSLRLQHC